MEREEEFHKWYTSQPQVERHIDLGVDVTETFEVDGVSRYCWGTTTVHHGQWLVDPATVTLDDLN